MKRLLASVVLLASLSGCVVLPVITRNKFAVIVTTNVEFKQPLKLGQYKYDSATNTCYIWLREYPKCLAHEMRHCMEGNWHGNAASSEDCYQH